MQFIGVGFFAQNCRAVVICKRHLDRVSVVLEIEHEYIMLLWVGAIQPRERLHRLDTG
jgi:hypothetical protein